MVLIKPHSALGGGNGSSLNVLVRLIHFNAFKAKLFEWCRDGVAPSKLQNTLGVKKKEAEITLEYRTVEKEANTTINLLELSEFLPLDSVLVKTGTHIPA